MKEIDNYGVEELLREIVLSRFDLCYVKILSDMYQNRATESEREEIEKTVKDTPFIEAIREYLQIPAQFKTSTVKINEIPPFYKLKLVPETENLINAQPIYDTSLTLILEEGSISTFKEALALENNLLSNLSSLWKESKKKIAVSLVAGMILAPMAHEAKKIWEHHSHQQYYTFESQSSYAQAFNEGLEELSKSKSTRLNNLLENLSDKEMKFFISNLEKAHDPLVDKEELEIQLALESLIPRDRLNQVKNTKALARSVKKHAATYELEPMLFLAIMRTESEFVQSATNKSGDLSIAQVNPSWWKKEFKRLSREPLDVKRLKEDPDYGIQRMGEILHIYKERFKDDPLWYANYHNMNTKRKIGYAKKVNRHLASVDDLQMEKIAEKILEIKAVALRIAETDDEVNTEKVKRFIASLERIQHEYSDSKTKGLMIAMTE